MPTYLLGAVDPVVSISLRVALALLLATAAIEKLSAFGTFRHAAAGYGLLPRAWLTPIAVLLIAAEIVGGGLLLLPQLGPFGALPAASLFGIYTAAITMALRRGQRGIDCGCAGPSGRLPLSPALAVRNGVLVGLTLVCASPMAPRSWVWIDAFTVFASVTLLTFLYASAHVALANTTRMDRPLVHVELTEGA